MQLDSSFHGEISMEIYVLCGDKKMINENVKCNYGNMLLSYYYIRIDNTTAGSLKYA